MRRLGPLETLSTTLIILRIFSGAWHAPQVPALMLLLVALIWLYQFMFESRCKEILHMIRSSR